MHGIFISAPVDGHVYLAERSAKGIFASERG